MRLIEVGAIGEAVPRLVRAGRPRSRGGGVITRHHYSPRGEECRGYATRRQSPSWPSVVLRVTLWIRLFTPLRIPWRPSWITLFPFVELLFWKTRAGVLPHRISLRLPARLLRLPLKGGVILPTWERGRPARILSLPTLPPPPAPPGQGANREHPLHNQPTMVPFAVDRSGSDRRSCAKTCAGGTPALPGGGHHTTSLFPSRGGVSRVRDAAPEPSVALRRSSWPFVDVFFVENSEALWCCRLGELSGGGLTRSLGPTTN